MRARYHLLLSFFLLTGTGTAQEHGPVLLFCDDATLGAGQGGCESMLLALAAELGDFGLSVEPAQRAEAREDTGEPVPPDIVDRVREAGAVFAVWFSRAEALTLHVYDPKNAQKLARLAVSVGEGGEIDFRDAAFRLRSLMGASLYSDLDVLVDDDVLMELAVPPERKEVLEKVVAAPAPPPPQRTWVVVNQGYLFLGYPAAPDTASHLYHGVCFDLAVLPVPRLEIFADGAVAFPQEAYSTLSPEAVRIENRQFLVGVGVRYEAVRLGPASLLPAAGFHLGISQSTVTTDGDRTYRKLNPALWAGLDLRVALHRHVALSIGLKLENLFHYERFSWGEERLYGLHQFRLGLAAGISVGI